MEDITFDGVKQQRDRWRFGLFKDKGFKYDPATGDFYNPAGKKIQKSKSTGSVVLGHRLSKDKIEVLLGHRFAWYYITGEVPDSSVVHKDGDNGNNKAENLQLVLKKTRVFWDPIKEEIHYQRGEDGVISLSQFL